MSPIIAESTAPKKIITIISGKVFKNGRCIKVNTPFM